jgi:hypothetical protein
MEQLNEMMDKSGCDVLTVSLCYYTTCRLGIHGFDNPHCYLFKCSLVYIKQCTITIR